MLIAVCFSLGSSWATPVCKVLQQEFMYFDIYSYASLTGCCFDTSHERGLSTQPQQHIAMCICVRQLGDMYDMPECMVTPLMGNGIYIVQAGASSK